MRDSGGSPNAHGVSSLRPLSHSLLPAPLSANRGSRGPASPMTETKNMRIVSWNIRAGGGRRAAEICAQLIDWNPDVICLCEFRSTPPSLLIAATLAAQGYRSQATTAEPEAAAANGLLIASRLPLRRLDLAGVPAEPRRWLAVQLEPPGPAVCLVHVPNMVTGRKWPFLASIFAVLEGWTAGPAVLLGDTNCGWPGLDEETAVFGKKTGDWLDSVEALGWRDTFRHLRPGQRAFTWYSPNAGNGFRIDQAFVNDALLARAAGVSYAWGGAAGGRRESLSDHAALLLDLKGEPAAGLPGALEESFESGAAGAASFRIQTSAN